jgi:CRP/FNR family transcriptional regulator, cyclic AMP receptor protein
MLTVSKILVLKKLPLFRDMSPDLLSCLAKITEERVVGKSQKIFEKGEEGTTLYVIVEGSVRIHDEYNINVPSKSLAILKEGEFFGELSILDNETRSASATAVVDSVLLEISQGSFQKIMIDNFDLAKNLISALAERIRNLTNKIQNGT